MLRSLVLITLLALIPSSAAAQDIDARFEEAAQLYRDGKYVEAAAIFEDLEQIAPANYLRLNAMFAWYKAERCTEARASISRIVEDSTLQQADREQMGKVTAFCVLKDAKAAEGAGDLEGALGLVKDLKTADLPLQREITAFRVDLERQIEQQKIAAAEEAKKPVVVVEEVPKPPDPPPPLTRPKWALWSGAGLAAAGVGLGIGTLVKVASDAAAYDETVAQYVAFYGCDYDPKSNVYGGCTEPGAESDAAFTEFRTDFVRKANTWTAVMGVSAGLLTAGGVGLLAYYLFTPPSAPATTMRLMPTFGIRAIGASLEIQF